MLVNIKRAGNACKKTKYPPNTPGQNETKKKAKRSKLKRLRDQFRARVDKLAMIIAANFKLGKDKHILLTLPTPKLEDIYSTAKSHGISNYLAAVYDLRKFLKSVQLKMRTDGVPFLLYWHHIPKSQKWRKNTPPSSSGCQLRSSSLFTAILAQMGQACRKQPERDCACKITI